MLQMWVLHESKVDQQTLNRVPLSKSLPWRAFYLIHFKIHSSA